MHSEISIVSIEEELVSGLSAATGKFIPNEFCYNDAGSALFRDLCREPDYYLSRTERRILNDNRTEILGLLSGLDVLELGAGDCSKLTDLTRQPDAVTFRYFPNDINFAILEEGMGAYAANDAANPVTAIPGDYFEALEQFVAMTGPGRAVLFLGSTIGNFSQEERTGLFSELAAHLDPGDIFVLACDLFKSMSAISAAYNGSSRIVKQMELQSLRYINQLYAGDFDTTSFTHFCDFDCASMYSISRLYSLTDQTVTLRKLGLTCRLKAGEPISMDKMWKPTLAQLLSCYDPARWNIKKTFLDDDFPYALVFGEVRG